MGENLTEMAAQRLARFCLGIEWAQLPIEVRERTKELVLDLAGVAIRGGQQASSAPAIELARTWGSGGRASVWTAGFRAAAPWAALANGTMAHAIEMDDVTTESSLHPGVAVIPAALSMAQENDAAPTR